MKITRKELRERIKLIVENENKENIKEQVLNYIKEKINNELISMLGMTKDSILSLIAQGNYAVIKSLKYLGDLYRAQNISAKPAKISYDDSKIKIIYPYEKKKNVPNKDIPVIPVFINVEGLEQQIRLIFIGKKSGAYTEKEDSKTKKVSATVYNDKIGIIIDNISASLGYILQYIRYDSVKKAIENNEGTKKGLALYKNSIQYFVIAKEGYSLSDNVGNIPRKYGYMSDFLGILPNFLNITQKPHAANASLAQLKKSHSFAGKLWARLDPESSLQMYYHEALHNFYSAVYKDVNFSSSDQKEINLKGINLSNRKGYVENIKNLFNRFFS